MNEVSIGFRVSPTEIHYSIVENNKDNFTFISISSLKIPISIDDPGKLSFIRNTVSTILAQYGVKFAGIKLIEGNARGSINNALIFRFNVEGVLMELFSTSSIVKYFLGVTSNISSILNIKKDKPQIMLDQILDANDYLTDNDKKVTGEYKEAMLVALAAMEVGLKDEWYHNIYKVYQK